MSYNDDRIEVKGMTEDNAHALKDSHETYDNPAYAGTVEVVKESDDTYTAIYNREDIVDYERIHEDSALFGGRTDKLYD